MATTSQTTYLAPARLGAANVTWLPGTMMMRARLFLSIAFFRHAACAVACFFAPIRSQALDPIIAVAPLWLWGVAFGLIAGVLAVAAVCGSEHWGRWVMIASVGITLFWAYCLTVSYVDGRAGGPFAAILFSSLAMKDLVIVAGPMSFPVIRLGD